MTAPSTLRISTACVIYLSLTAASIGFPTQNVWSRPFPLSHASGELDKTLLIGGETRDRSRVLADILSPTATFSNTGNITIPATNPPGGSPAPGAPATPYPSNIAVSGLPATGISKVTVSLNNFSHNVPDDVDILLVGPTGANLIIMSDAGGVSPTGTINITLDDSAASDLPDTGGLPSGTYRPKNYASTSNGGSNDNFPSPAPAPSANTSLGAAFNNTNPNGTWSLYVIDDASGDIGSIAGGWTLNITQGVAAQATTTTLVSSNSDYIQTNQTVTFTATVRKQSDSTVVGAVGTVTFKEGATTLAGPTALNASGVAAFAAPASTFNANNHTITAEYADSSSTFLPSSTNIEQVVDNPTTQATNTFTNTGTISIPQTSLALQTPGKASPYSSHLNVSGLAGSISNVTVTLTNFSHGIPKDVDMLLVSPLGGASNLILLSDIGGTSASGTVTLTLSDAAASSLPTTSPLSTGTFKPTNINTGSDDSFAAPSPAASANSTLNGAFAGISPNGVWRLYIMDDAGGDIGTLGGWSMTFTTTGDAATTTSVTTTQPDFSISGTSVTFTATVNSGVTPVTAGTVTFKEGASVLAGPSALNASGQASFSTTALAIGNHTITADYSGVAGQFNLSSGNVGQSVDTATVRTVNSFCNSGSIPIPNPAIPGGGAPANPYPSHVTVSSLGGVVSKVTVSFNGVTHTNPDDIDALLASPTATQNIVLMSDAGGATDISNVNLVFDDAAASQLPDNTTISSGTFKPTDQNGGVADSYPAPAPAASSSAPQGTQTLATAFPNSVNPNGVWRLYIVDDAGADTGSLSGGWCVNFTLSNANTTTAVTASTNPIITGQSVTLTANVGVVAPGIGIPTGTVQFQDNGVNLGAPQTVNASGVAALTTTALTTPGTRTITGIYTPTGSFNTSSGTLAGGIQVNSSAVWTGGASSAWTTAGNWTTGAVPASINDVSIPSTGVTNEPTISTAVTLGNITEAVGRTLTVGSTGSLSVTGTCTVNGTANIGGTATCGTLAGTGTVNFTGAAVQSIPALTYQNLGITNAAGVNLAGNVTVNGVLTLGGGNVNAGANVLTISATGSVTRTSGIVIGSMQKIFGGVAAFTYPVGTAGAFSPVDVNVTAGSGSLSVKANTGTAPATPALVTANTLQRYWDLNGSGITADVTWHYLDGDVMGTEANYRIIKIPASGTPISVPNSAGCPTTGTCVDPPTNRIIVHGLTSFSLWTAGTNVTTAANVTVAGRVVRPDGRAGMHSLVSITDEKGNVRTAMTNPFGYFRFTEVESGQSYVVSVTDKGFAFSPQFISVTDSVTDLVLTLEPRP